MIILYFSRSLIWYQVNEVDQNQIFFPTLQIIGAWKIERMRHYGPMDNDYFWFLHPNMMEWQLHPDMLEFQQHLKVTIYCPFVFKTFPFDTNYCDFSFGALENENKSIQLNSTRIRYKHKRLHQGEGLLYLDESYLPFDIYLESKMPFEVELAGMWYSFTGMKITLTRNNFDELQGSFYGPTLMFSLLSLVSYGISEDSVRIFSILIKSLCKYHMICKSSGSQRPTKNLL